MRFPAGKILLFAMLLSHTLDAQVMSQDTVTRKASIRTEKNGNKVQFTAETPPLNQVAGAPKAFYTYFWEFGDGHFSFEERPVHIYKDKGEYTAELWVTNHYDNGKPPPSRPEKIGINGISTPVDSSNQDHPLPSGFALRKIREPVPNEKKVVVMSYKNTNNYTSSGKLYLYFNEHKYKANNFQLLEAKTYHGEQPIEEPVLTTALPSNFNNVLMARNVADNNLYNIPFSNDSSEREDLNKTKQESTSQFKDKQILEFHNLKPEEQRNIFFIMQTTPEMLQDTSAIINIRGVFVPDKQFNNHKVEDLEMEINTSHDPNKMAVSDTRVNYRLFPGRKLKYKVKFQNNGEGPANTVRLEIDVPPTVDKSTLEVLDLYPACPICPDGTEVNYSCLDTLFTEDKMALTFKNIHLPGSRQKGVNAYDSTKGFVKYTLLMNEKVPKVNSVSRTAIIFDKNEPILTNYAKTRFKPGLSIGALAGYTSQPALGNSNNYTFGITASPFKPYKGYFQWELMASLESYEHFDQHEIRNAIEPDIDEIAVVTEERNIDNLKLTLVPISYRYNLAKFLNVGAGLQISTKLTEKIGGTTDYRYFMEITGMEQREPNPDKDITLTIDEKNSLVGFVPGAFAGINIGSVRVGPCAGLRYIYQTKKPQSQWMFYLLWKI